ncbi:MAG: hypothetical protein EOO01_30070 [Chitinophagaceae bacterium]|nr:MAG: hypothetical protein EOO01_30070 [Chitinophagaceae bacterium]
MIASFLAMTRRKEKDCFIAALFAMTRRRNESLGYNSEMVEATIKVAVAVAAALLDAHSISKNIVFMRGLTATAAASL